MLNLDWHTFYVFLMNFENNLNKNYSENKNYKKIIVSITFKCLIRIYYIYLGIKLYKYYKTQKYNAGTILLYL